MKKEIMRVVNAFHRKEDGMETIEWVIVLALVAALLAVVISINTRVNSTASNAQKTIDSKLGEVDAQLGAGTV